MRFKLLALMWCTFLGTSYAMVADLYLNKDKFGEFFKLEINEKGCTNVPLNWENQAVSLDTHGSCIKFYDLPYCRGKYVALQPFHGTFQDNLQTLGFSKLISSASPCGPKVPTGRYYIQNGADGSVLTIEMKNHTPIARAHPFKPYISKGQQFQIEKVALADYEIVPRLHQKLNPLTFDMSVSTAAHPVRRLWKIESVYRGRYLIKNEWSNRCLYKSDSGKVEEHECVSWSPNQEWVFRSIKVKPYFPSKEDLKKNPLRPDEVLPFEPQEDAFSSIPFSPNSLSGAAQFGISPPPLPPSRKKGGKKPIPVQVQRPGPLVINPGEPFPPVFPFPIVPKPALPPFSSAGGNKQSNTPPVPHVRHPGPLPFPAVPVVTDPKKPVVSPFDTYNPTGAKTPQVEQEEDEESKEENEDELKSDEKEEKESGERDEEQDEDSNERDQEGASGEKGLHSDEQDDIGYEGPPRPSSHGSRPPRPSSDEQDDRHGPARPPRPSSHGPRPPRPGSDEQDDLGYESRPPRPSSHGPPRPGSEEKDDDRFGPPPGVYDDADEYQGYDRDEPEDDRYEEKSSEEDRENIHKRRKEQEKAAGVKYSDYRLHF